MDILARPMLGGAGEVEGVGGGWSTQSKSEDMYGSLPAGRDASAAALSDPPPSEAMAKMREKRFSHVASLGGGGGGATAGSEGLEGGAGTGTRSWRSSPPSFTSSSSPP